MKVAVLLLWVALSLLILGTTALVMILLWRWARVILRRQPKQQPLSLQLIAQEYLRAQARLMQLKRRRPDLTSKGRAEQAEVSTQASEHWANLQQFGRRIAAFGAWLGWPNIVIGLIALSCVLGGLLWNAQRQPPLPAGAYQVRASIITGLARQTSYRVPSSIEEVRAYYQRELPKQGWQYCGTQAIPRCSNLAPAGSEREIDVYRRLTDRGYEGSSIEVWPQRDPNGQTFVIVFEVRQQ